MRVGALDVGLKAVWGFESLPLLCEQKAAGWHLADPRRTMFSSTFLG